MTSTCSRRSLLAGATALLFGSAVRAQRLTAPSNLGSYDGPVRPEWFGAKGDGRTNDTRAMAALAAHVNQRGGGEIIFRPVTYIVGEQIRAARRDTPYAYDPLALLEFEHCTRPLVIRGNGARLRCAPGLRFGTFDPTNGEALGTKSPYYGANLASPYRWMIKVAHATAPIEIRDLELDGNQQALVLGGYYGDTGRQIPASGIGLYDNRAAERLVNIYSHHHALDGLLIDGAQIESLSPVRVVENVRCEFNGRQGCSITGGYGYNFLRCRFNNTGRGRIFSGPGAGVDIEAENKKNRNHRFTDCEFSGNRGCGLLAAEGDNDGASFLRCRFVGTGMWAAWPHLPHARFRACTFVGPIVNCWGSANRELATQFFDCTFLDDPRLSPTGELYVGQNKDGPIADLYDNPNVLFRHCTFNLTHKAALPWTTHVVIFEDCTMVQAASQPSYPRGTFVGRNVIRGNVDLYSAVVHGDLIVNGRPVPRTP